MSETPGRLKTVVVAVIMLAVVGAATAYIATHYGTNRALTVLVAIALIAALAWLVLSIVSVISATRTHKERIDTLKNETRPVPRRGPVLPDAPREVGRRRKNPDA